MTSVVFYNVSATPDEPPLKTFDEFIKRILTYVVFYNVSATSVEPPPKTSDDLGNENANSTGGELALCPAA